MEILNNMKEPPKIRVVVRKRPLTGKELKRNDMDILEMIDSETLIIKELKYLLL
jgi:hypothetical protein